MIWQPEFTDKTLSRKPGAVHGSRTVAELESEILQLRKALNEARLERDILKKATVDSICQCNTPFNYLFRCFELQCLSRSVV
ncbi:hypothetical protein GQL97_23205 [Escherichia coli]|nr:hypothetical protein [Escherichia coli]